MAQKRLHDDFESNKRQRELKTPSMQDQLDALWGIVSPLIDDRKLKGKAREVVKAFKKAKSENPEVDD